MAFSEGGILKFTRLIDEAESYFIEGKGDDDAVKFLKESSAKYIYDHLDLEQKKKNGIFFTGEELAKFVAKKIERELIDGAVVIDPACGAGDLLIACANIIVQHKGLDGFYEITEKIMGSDIEALFCRLAKLRVALVASDGNDDVIYRSERGLSDLSENFKPGDFTKNPSIIKKADCVVLNPPFASCDVTGLVSWGSGKTQLAAYFLDLVVRNANKGQRVIAILPDVLRSGTRYEKWRLFISKYTNKINIDVIGRFDNKTDVDVFVADFCISEGFEGKNDSDVNLFCDKKTVELHPRVSDFFDISVGPVVPHRDEEEGEKSFFYVDSSSYKKNRYVELEKRKRYQKTLKNGPLVLIKRTSSPSDESRICAAIVRDEMKILVENHLIVAIPKSGKVDDCEKLLDLFLSDQTRDWINARIRCRHLTVGSIKDIPTNNYFGR